VAALRGVEVVVVVDAVVDRLERRAGEAVATDGVVGVKEVGEVEPGPPRAEGSPDVGRRRDA